MKHHEFKNWYYTDKLWHRPDLANHKPPDSAMYMHKKWKVPKWTYADSAVGGRRLLLAAEEGLGDHSLSSSAQAQAPVERTPAPLRGRYHHRRLLGKAGLGHQHQTETIMVEKNCLRELYTLGIIDASEDLG